MLAEQKYDPYGRQKYTAAAIAEKHPDWAALADMTGLHIRFVGEALEILGSTPLTKENLRNALAVNLFLDAKPSKHENQLREWAGLPSREYVDFEHAEMCIKYLVRQGYSVTRTWKSREDM